MAGSTLVNGEACDSIALADRGLAYGDGLFETIALTEGRPELLQAHLARLRAGALRLGLPAPTDAVWLADLQRLTKTSDRQRQVLKLTLTRGVGGRGYAPPELPVATRILQIFDWQSPPDSHRSRGVTVHLCDTRLGINPTLAGLKHLNRLEQVLAARETAVASADEGLMLDCEGRLVEGVRTNVFLVLDGALHTPALQRCGIRGVMRDFLIEGAHRIGLPVQEGDYDVDTVRRASEIFLCNSLIGIWPVRALAGPLERTFRVGPVTQCLQAWLDAQVLTE